MTDPIRVVQYGLGPIGLASVAVLLKKQATGHVQLAGAIDIDPDKAGRDVAELLHRDEPSGIVVSADAAQVLDDVKPDVVVHTTTSFLGRMHEQLVQCAEAGAHVVSSTEELAYPYERHPEVSAELDRVAQANGVVILGTGVLIGLFYLTRQGCFGLMVLLLANGALLAVSLVGARLEKRVRSIPVGNEELAAEYEHVCHSWVKKPLPDF